MKHKAIIFDVDGTLLNTHEYIFQSFEHSFKVHGLVNLSRKDVVPLMGKPLEECYKILAPQQDNVSLCEAHRGFQEENINLVQPFTNTIKALKTFKEAGVKLGAVSTRKQTGLQSLEHSGVVDYLDVIITGDDVEQFKPHPEGVLKALAKLQVSPQAAVMVGDTAVDIEAGKNAGTKTVAVTYGFAPREVLESSNPDMIIDDIAELIDLLQ